MRSVAVFCGSRSGRDPAWQAAAAALGGGLAAAGIGLVYGGGRMGLMGTLADAALAGGGSVTGVIPRFLVGRELAHRSLTRLIEVDSLHARKQTMLELSDAVVALPGGFGTFDELIEAITWRLLGLHDKPIYVCDCNGWAAALVALFAATSQAGFCAEDAGRAWEVVPDVPALLARLRA